MNAQLKLEIHNIHQGTDSWHQFRSTHYGASETAAMLGISPYMTRTELLHLKATGESKEHSEFTKAIFNKGHNAEEFARQLLEARGLDFYPVTCSFGKMSASCDGLTFDNSLAFEHKMYSDELAEKVKTGLVPDYYLAQCQQILMITNADKLLFVCSDGTTSKWKETEVYPDCIWFDRINAGWLQFERDLANYEQRILSEKPEAAAIMQLPTLSIQIKGEVTLSNLPQFKEAAEIFIANINTDLKNDNDFANAEATVKFCDDTEKKLESAKAAAIGQTASIDELMKTIDFIKESIRAKRLTLEKLVKTQKESIKKEIIDTGIDICGRHARDLASKLMQIDFMQMSTNHFSRLSFESVCKNKRTLSSLHNAVDTEVAAIKIKLDDLARIVRKNLTNLPEDLSLFRDLQSIITKPEDDFKLLVESRMAEQKRKDDEAAQRAISEAKAAEEKDKQDLIDAQERERIAKENEEKRIQEAKALEASRLELQAKTKAELELQQAELKLKEKSARAADEGHRKKIHDEALESLKENGFNRGESERLLTAIMNCHIKHISINF